MLGLIYFLLSLGLIVLVHELGHLVVAKRNDVYCHEFSIGMGPKIMTITTDKQGTVYNLRAIPLGGYVMMAGEESEKEADSNVPKSMLLNNKTTWQRFRVLIAGSTMNIILTIVLLSLLAFFTGAPTNSNEVNIVKDSSAAKVIDSSVITIKEVNEKPVDNFSEIQSELKNSDKKLELKYLDEKNTEKTVEITKNDQNLIGISQTKDKFRPIRSIKSGLMMTGTLFMSLLVMLKELFGSQYGVNDLSGPIGIYQVSSNVLNIGLSASVIWIAYLSINIGIMNLLPIPALDGGRLVFVIYEMITKKKVNAKVETYLIIGSMLLLLGLFVVVSFNDILRIFS